MKHIFIIGSRGNQANYGGWETFVTKLVDNYNDKRIVFIYGIYNDEKLSVVRKNAYAYVHGYSVGETNPSLLEALNITKLNRLYNVNFNKDVGIDSCIYFKDNSSLTNILNNIKKYDRNKLGSECRKIIKNNFTWDIIVNKYKKLFK